MTTRTAKPTTTQKPSTAEPPATTTKRRVVKVLVWDLDETLWHGTLLEGDALRLRDGVRETLDLLDQRGILQSIASKNDSEQALAALERFGLRKFFLFPQIGWSAKSVGLERIAEALNLGLDSFAFLDDQPFEREEVGHRLPQVLTLDAAELDGLTAREEFIPRFITDESARRREMYAADLERKQAEEGYVGPQDDFLASLAMRFSIAPCRVEDLRRAEELTQRTNQLNATGYTYDYDELAAFRESPDHLLLVAELDDKYGAYGKIGLALVERGGAAQEVWTLKLLLMSCRVMSRGVGAILLGHIMQRARDAGARLLAEFLPTDRNRMMHITYRFAGFREIERRADGLRILESDLEAVRPFPDYVEMRIEA